tara:strand:- start:785 stop:1606 length:822 start_codon:yes stop_codon:yes gene_type:complete
MRSGRDSAVHRARRIAGLLVFASIWVSSPLVAATTFATQESYRGLTLAAVAERRGETFDIAPLGYADATARIKNAIDILYDRSPLSASAIETLRGAGEVIVVYDPHFPKSRLAGLTIAAFFPDYYQADGPSKRFVTVVGRYGAKWPAAELAAVLAHELVGHGMQHYRGRLRHVRTIDLECEAYLYEEQAYQDLGIDKRSNEMIRFRQALEDHWCKMLRAYTKRNEPNKMALWERLNPDVPRILDVYLRYVERLRRNGTAGKAIDIERREGLRR